MKSLRNHDISFSEKKYLIESFEEKADSTTENKIIILLSQGILEQYEMNTGQAFRKYYNAFKLSENIIDIDLKYSCRLHLAHIYFLSRFPEKAIPLVEFDSQEEKNCLSKHLLARIYFEKALIYQSQNKLDVYKSYLNFAIEELKKYHDKDEPEIKAQLLDMEVELALNNYQETGEFITLESFLQKLIKHASQNSLIDQLLIAKLTLIRLHLETGRYHKCDSLFTNIHEIINQYIDKSIYIKFYLIETYGLQYILFKEQENYKLAIEYLEKKIQLEDNLRFKSDLEKVIQLELENELLKSSFKEEKLIQNLKSEKINRLFWITILTLLILIGVLILMTLQNKIKNQKLLATKELELKNNKLAHLKSIVENKSREIDKVNYLLDEKINTINILKHETKTNLSGQREKILNMKISTNSDWEELKKLYEKIYPTILPELITKFGSLSENEQRIIILLHIGIKKSEQANILGVSYDAIRKSHYRLLKKLNLSSIDDLLIYMRKLE